MILPLLSKMLVLGSVMALGFYLDRAGKISRDGLQALSKLVLHYLLPCLAFSTIVDHFSLDVLRRAAFMPLLGFLTFVVGMAVGLLTMRWLPLPPAAQRTYVFLSAVCNYGYLPLPLVYLLYGNTGAALLFFHNLGCHVFFWTIGIAILAGGSAGLRGLRNIFNNNVIALAASLVIAALGAGHWIPAFFLDLTRVLGMAAVPLVTVIIGSTMAEIHFSRGMPWRAMGMMSVMRLLIIPVLIAGMIYLFPIPRGYRTICILVGLMPCASGAPLLVMEYGGDKTFAAQAVLVTTILSMITIPVGLAVFLN